MNRMQAVSQMRATAAIAFLLASGLVVGCRPSKMPVAVEGPQSPPGWEVRYNAAAALARRGSVRALDDRVRDTLLEMLDEEQQMRNFRREVNGRMVSDVNSAALTVVTTLQAIHELHQRQPSLDLIVFHPAIDKLLDSPNLVVRTEAKKTKQSIINKK
jgi:hypothetical protein